MVENLLLAIRFTDTKEKVGLVDIFMKQPMFRKIAANVLQLVVVWGK